MRRFSLATLERRCQKPDHRRVGNWMARHVARPAALRITRVVAPWGVSANVATLAAWGCGVAAALALGWGTVGGWIAGAVMLQLWYLLDHVDGQLARLRGTASLDGVQLDYLMHHTVNLLVPLGIGWGLFVRRAEPIWAAAGLLWAVALLLIGLHHDARYKAFIQRLKRIRGRLCVVGGGGGRPQPQPPLPVGRWRRAAWVARKACEMHVIANTLVVIAVFQLLAGDTRLVFAMVYLAAVMPASVAVAGWTIVRSQRAGTAEAEFAAWYRPLRGEDLVFSNGWWQAIKKKEKKKGTGAYIGESGEYGKNKEGVPPGSWPR